jgi:hypothetical protein
MEERSREVKDWGTRRPSDSKGERWTTLYFGRECDFAIVMEGNKN